MSKEIDDLPSVDLRSSNYVVIDVNGNVCKVTAIGGELSGAVIAEGITDLAGLRQWCAKMGASDVRQR